MELSFLIIIAFECDIGLSFLSKHHSIYHVYKSVWELKETKVLLCSHRANNIYSMFAIKTCLADENGKEQITGHLPLELS